MSLVDRLAARYREACRVSADLGRDTESDARWYLDAIATLIEQKRGQFDMIEADGVAQWLRDEDSEP